MSYLGVNGDVMKKTWHKWVNSEIALCSVFVLDSGFMVKGLKQSNQIYFQMQKQCTQQTCNAFRWYSKVYSTYSCPVLTVSLLIELQGNRCLYACCAILQLFVLSQTMPTCYSVQPRSFVLNHCL